MKNFVQTRHTTAYSIIYIMVIIFIWSSTTAFGQSATVLQQNIKTLEKELLQKKEELNKPLAAKLIKAYKNYATTFDKDTLSASYLMKAADISRGIGKCSQSIVLLEKAKISFPNVKEVESVLFLQGYIFENCLKDTPKARKSYESFIKKYPNHRLVNVAKTSLQFLGKSPEELLKIIEKQ